MFGLVFLLFAAPLTAAVDDLQPLYPRMCDNTWVEIINQTDIDFYKTCPIISGSQLFIDHEFNGPFELPGVESAPEVSSGYYAPKFKGDDRVDDGVTSVSMPDLTNVTKGGILFGYIDNLTSISFPKLAIITGDLAIEGSDNLRNISFPSLSTVDGGVLLDGDFNQIKLPSLKSAWYIRVLSTGNISCPALGAAFASITFVDKSDFYHGFTCWTGYENNSWNSSDPDNNPTVAGSSPTSTSSGISATSTSLGSSATNTKTSAANAPRVSYVATVLLSAWVICLITSIIPPQPA